VIVYCWLLHANTTDIEAGKVKMTMVSFCAETEMAAMLRVKSATGGLNTDKLGGRNCVPYIVPLANKTSPAHGVIVFIGKEERIKFGSSDHAAVDAKDALLSGEPIMRLHYPAASTAELSGMNESLLSAEDAQMALGGAQATSERVTSGTAKLRPDDRKVVQDFLVRYRKLLTESRGYVLGQVMHVDRLTDLAAWRQAQANGTLREFQRLADLRCALWANPEEVFGADSTGKLANCLNRLKLGPTPDDLRLCAAWERYSQITFQLGDAGPQNDGQVQVWQQATLTLLHASLSVHTTDERLLEHAAKKWKQG
jgi:hypothetical protein